MEMHNYAKRFFANFCKNFEREKPYFGSRPFLNCADLFDTASAVLHTLSLT